MLGHMLGNTDCQVLAWLYTHHMGSLARPTLVIGSGHTCMAGWKRLCSIHHQQL